MKTFMEILIEKVGENKSNSAALEYDTSPRHMSYIMGLQGKNTNQQASPRAWNYYKPKPRPAHALTTQQCESLDFFNQFNADLKNNFNGLELKKAFRQLAKKFHPDVSKISGSAEIFINLKKHYDILTQVLA